MSSNLEFGLRGHVRVRQHGDTLEHERQREGVGGAPVMVTALLDEGAA
jgi:hypothetical protein